MIELSANRLPTHFIGEERWDSISPGGDVDTEPRCLE